MHPDIGHDRRCRGRSGSGRPRSRDAGTPGRCRRHGCRRSCRECFSAIAEHSMMPARTPRRRNAARRRPARLALLRRLPQHEIHRIALIGRHLDARAGLHLVERAARELAVIRHARRRGTAHAPRRHRRSPCRPASRSSPSSLRYDRSRAARTSGGRQPSAATSAWNCAVVSLGQLANGGLGGMSGYRSAARALILSSTSVMLRT